MSNAIVLNVEGLEFHADTVGDEPRVLDIELAERLGYARPRKVRDLIARLMTDGILKDFEVRPTVGQTSERGGRPSTVYWLTESGALKVTARSDTPQAIAQLDFVIRVFLAVKRKLVPPTSAPALPPSPSGFLATLAACKTIGENPEWKKDVRALIGYAAFRANCSWAKAHGSLRQYLGVSGYCRIPASLVDETKRYLHKMASTPLMLAPKRALKLVGDPRQTVIPFGRSKS